MEKSECHDNASVQQDSDEHLCVLIHGLWGNPGHLSFLAKSLKEKHPTSKLHVLVTKSNSNNYTYDGIDVGAERVGHEIEEKLEQLARDGVKIRKLSIIGYSLGGLIARYVIGLLYSKGKLDQIEPVNFTTFATPHLGVRTPLRGPHMHLWNVLGARLLSASGRQLFMIDSFRDTGEPLLSLLADPGSIFIKGLAKFRNRSLYCNIINDRSAVFYTTGISRNDPFTDLSKVNVQYIKGYEPVIVDPDNPVTPRIKDLPTTFSHRLGAKSANFARTAPWTILKIILIPVFLMFFIIHSFFESFRSSRRIRLHETEVDGVFGTYRIPLLVDNVQSAVEGVIEGINNARDQEYLDDGTEEVAAYPNQTQQASPRPSQKLAIEPPTRSSETTDETSHSSITSKHEVVEAQSGQKSTTRTLRRYSSELSDKPAMPRKLDLPTLALHPRQFAMIRALDDIGFKKWPVHIHKSDHSHAAIIYRRTGPNFDEGLVVARHWLDEGFDP